MLDVAATFRTIVCGTLDATGKACPAMDAGQLREANVSAAWADVERIVTAYRDHPALLGWYVCDDCMTSWIVAQRTAGTPTVDHVYNRLKKLDPWHVVIGAVESIDMFVFDSNNVFVGHCLASLLLVSWAFAGLRPSVLALGRMPY